MFKETKTGEKITAKSHWLFRTEHGHSTVQPKAKDSSTFYSGDQLCNKEPNNCSAKNTSDFTYILNHCQPHQLLCVRICYEAKYYTVESVWRRKRPLRYGCSTVDQFHGYKLSDHTPSYCQP